MLKRPEMSEAHHMFGPVGGMPLSAIDEFIGIQHGVESGNRGKRHRVIRGQNVLCPGCVAN